MALEGLPADLAGNEVLGGFENVESLARGHLELVGRSAPERWREGLPEDIREDASLSRLGNPEALARAFIETKSLVGRKRAQPAEDATPEQWAEYWRDLGRPETPEEYELARPADFPEQFYSAELEGVFRKAAHHYGLNAKQTQGIFSEFVKANQGLIGQMLQVEVDNKAAGVQALKTAWGDQYEDGLQAADYAIQVAAGSDAEVAKSIAAKDPIWNHPVLARVLAYYGRLVREPGSLEHGHNEVKLSLMTQRKELMESEPYTNARHKDHDATVDKVLALGKEIWPEKAGAVD